MLEPNDNAIQDPLKPLSELCKPDERQQFFLGDISDGHAELSAIVLHDCVPASTRQMFETAKNLSLYAWFVYRFHPMSELAGWLALENALLEKMTQEGLRKPDDKRSPGLRRLLERAMSDGWLTEERIPGRLAIARARVSERKTFEAIQQENEFVAEPTEDEVRQEAATMQLLPTMCRAAANLRNSMAHGSNRLHPNSRTTLRVTAGLINQLFE